MNQVTTRPAKALPPPEQPDARAIATALKRIRQNLIVPMETTAGLDRYPGWFTAMVEARDAVMDRDRLRQRLQSTGSMGDHNRERVRNWLAALPPAAEARTAARTLRRLTTTPADRGELRAMLGLMIDGFPNARPHSPISYLEQMAAQLEAGGYSDAIIAQACEEVRCTMSFLPSIAEVLALVQKHQDRANRMLPHYEGVAGVRQALEETLAQAEATPAQPEPTLRS